MIRKLFTIRDSKAEIYNASFQAHTHGEAERNFKRLANDTKTSIGQNPEDFDLYYLGTFDDIAGKHDLLQTPQHVVKALNLLDQNPTQLQS